MSVEPGVAAAAAQAQALGSTPYVRLRAGRDGGEFVFPAQVSLGSIRANPAPRRSMQQRILHEMLGISGARSRPFHQHGHGLCVVYARLALMDAPHSDSARRVAMKQVLGDLSSTAKGMLSTNAFAEVCSVLRRVGVAFSPCELGQQLILASCALCVVRV